MNRSGLALSRKTPFIILIALFSSVLLMVEPSLAQSRKKTHSRQRSHTREAPSRLPQVSTESSSPDNLELQQQIRALLTRPEFATASIGVKILMPDSGQVIFEQDAERLLMPASNMKLFTTAAAVANFDANYRIRTSVYAPSRPDAAGTLNGDITLYGRGDPSLASKYVEATPPFELLAKQLVEAGVKQINGNLVADESYLRGSPLGQGWEWMDLQWYFGTEISALTVCDNSIDILVRPGAKLGQPATINLTPDIGGYVTIENTVTTVAAGGKREIGINRGLSDNTIVVWGTIPLRDSGFQSRIAVHRPAGLAATLFQRALESAGIKLTGKIKIIDAALPLSAPTNESELTKRIELASIESAPLSELVRIVNKFSHNLYAELLLRQLGKVRGPSELNSDDAGVEVVKTLLRRAGVDVEVLSINDGSGLSRRDLVNANSIAQLLRYMKHQPGGELLQSSLPVAATDGTLSRRMSNTFNIQAKTGTLTNTSALSGYLTTAASETLVFSIIINHFTGNLRQAVAAEDAICTLLANYSKKLAVRAAQSSGKD